MDIWENLLENLESYRNVNIAIRHCMSFYENRCSAIIKEIKSKSYDESQTLFNEIFDIQNKLATAKYKYEFKLNDKLEDLVFCFERDDSYSREYWYKCFKEGLEWPEEK
ncbi:hypothetical protein [Comamonas sp. CMM02]|uniref:hypothetical protein n=1 Tax=Comamonas sp. CMM02 TaxID=2769307 RepID=UPI0017850953|nr:hypothetical protein [Comamonas sp. CMM02]MBD9402829.1 hypothetical protein [Comamonas sp. CMM02]